MALIQLHRKGQLTLPEDLCAQLGLGDGDFFELEVNDGVIVLRPKKPLDASQAYFWSEAWQAAERQASDDIVQGRTTRFPDAQSAIAHLRQESLRRRTGRQG